MRLQEANKDLESFAYSVSHDLRAPLRHIDGYATALRSNILETLSNTDQHYLARITDSAKRMGTLIDDLLVFSRMGRRELIKRRVSFDQLIQGCMIELEPEYHERKIEWDIQHLGTIYADPNLFKQVMINLLSNALKFTQTKPVAHITVGKKVYDDGRIEYYVKDNGVGFDMKYSNKLFGVFQRLHRDDEFKGTGIGLANVKRIISRHGGTITATAALNEGACFTFVIPQD
jgi:light-regulated signal transduction histidine kinase (bacteriophytochrome)